MVKLIGAGGNELEKFIRAFLKFIKELLLFLRILTEKYLLKK